MSSQQPYEVGIASILWMRKLRHKEMKGLPKVTDWGRSSILDQAMERLPCRTKMGSYTGHLLGWVSDSPQEPTPHSPEVSVGRERWWFLRLLKGKPTGGPKHGGVVGNAEAWERTGLSCLLPARDCQGVRKIPLCISLQTGGCKCYWLFFFFFFKCNWFTILC